MSMMPPNLVGPILQSSVMQGQLSSLRDTQEAQRASAERRHTAAVDAQDSTVETTDNDTQVYADAEGTGSQGRAFSETPEQQEPAESEQGGEVEGRNIDLEA